MGISKENDPKKAGSSVVLGSRPPNPLCGCGCRPTCFVPRDVALVNQVQYACERNRCYHIDIDTRVYCLYVRT